jgi:hypothetical protein
VEEPMIFSYGKGAFREGEKSFSGEIILSEHKLYLRDSQGDLSTTYIPLEKIVKIQKVAGGLAIYVRTSLTVSYTAVITGGKEIGSLLNDLVQRRRLKKRFLRREWVDITEMNS